jgi:hypothetical protein
MKEANRTKLGEFESGGNFRVTVPRNFYDGTSQNSDL